mmetsp:Transcript_6226/g.13614  ORF Transcript_6226/g.13614 Transcript_6226/m.13614 type:complete len:421 (-) Transcript_6226:713-1975(-)
MEAFVKINTFSWLSPPRKRIPQSAIEAKKGHGEVYYRNMLANRAKEAGYFVPPKIVAGKQLANDAALLDDYIKSQLQSYVTGCPPRPWLSGAGSSVAATTVQPVLQNASPAAASSPVDGSGRLKGLVMAPPQDFTGSGTIPLLKLPQAAEPTSNVVHVFWDVEDKHPEGMDPRILVHRIKAVASAYGSVAGVYAYVTRKASNWVADAFFDLARETLAAQQQQKQQKHKAGANKPQLKCPVCGALRKSAPELQQHVQMVHGRRGGSGGGSKPLRIGPAKSLGAVKLYHNSTGQAFTPPAGYQLNLRYVLRCEGVDVRLVQNAREDPSIALEAGLDRHLVLMQQGPAARAALLAGGSSVVVVVSDDPRLGPSLTRLSGGGVSVVRVMGDAGAAKLASSGRKTPGGMLLLDWEMVKFGEYALE